MSAHIEIPYNETERADTGLCNAKLGIWLFLASEVMLFGALFSTYVLLRTGAASWETGHAILNWKLAMVNTFVLIGSSVTMVMSWAALKQKDFAKYKLYMAMTVLCGVAFLVIKSIEYQAKFEHGLLPSRSIFMAIYFTMTGLHGLHVIGGMIVNGYLLGPGAKMWFTEPQRFTNRIEVAGLYWHFVDLVWIFLFPTLYLMPGK